MGSNFAVTTKRLALIGVGLTMPIEHLPLGIGALTPNKLATGLLLLIVAFLWLARRPRLPGGAKSIWVLFFFAAVIIGLVQSIMMGNPLGGNRGVFNHLQTATLIVIFYFLLGFALEKRQDLDLLLGAFVAGTVMAALSGWLGFGTGTAGGRLAGQGSSPNLLAFNVLIAIGAVGALFTSSRSTAARFVLGGTLAFLAVALVATLSRSGYVAFMAMVLLWGIRLRHVGFLRYGLPGLALGILVVTLAPETALERAATLSPDRLGEDSSARARLVMFPDAFRAFMSNPITGRGLAGFIPWSVENAERPGGLHSSFLQVMAEHGLLGLVPFVAIHVLTWREYTRAWQKSRRLRFRRDLELDALQMRALFLQLSFAAAILMSQAQPSSYHKGLWMLFAASSVVLLFVRQRAAEIAPEQEPSPATSFEAAPALASPWKPHGAG